MKDYHINVFFSEGDGCYVADLPDLTFCSACGKSPEEAVREVQIAKAAWLKSARRAASRFPSRATDRRFTNWLASLLTQEFQTLEYCRFSDLGC